MSTAGPGLVLPVILALLAPARAQDPRPHPLEFFAPQVSIDASERRQLDAGGVIVKRVASSPGDVAVFSAARVDINGDRLVSWVRRIEALKRGPHVRAIARFSSPPRLDDLETLELGPDDVEALRRCRSGSCGVKLSEADILDVSARAGGAGPQWSADAQQAFRRVVLQRVLAYLARGLPGLSPYQDGKRPVHPAREFEAILAASSGLTSRLPVQVGFLRGFPSVPEREVGDGAGGRTGGDAGIESFLYWSHESLGGKPIVSVTHVTIGRPDGTDLPDAIVLARQVYASHYMTGALAVTAIVGGRDGRPAYLAYLNRSRLDVLDGVFAGLVRRIVERRLRNEAGEVVDAVRRRLQSGEP